MIVQLSGTLTSKEPGHCVIDVGGVGYGLCISLTSLGQLPEAGQKASVAVHTYVREDQLSLYGFTTEEERTIFRKLISISGIGPKIALAVLSGLTPEGIVAAVGTRDHARLATIPGIGKKTAERMVVELGDMFAREMRSRPQHGAAGPAVFADALSALTNLGYQRAHAENALKKAAVSEEMKVEDAIKAALRELCKA
ncbi:MAG: Holliday junction branch migration protein RuvA [Proteobacteria bacterium]|nr:Holliday junction branch migration protein RuvA [Pseudomonadota bacterium]